MQSDQKMTRLCAGLFCVFTTLTLAESTARRYEWTVKYGFTPPKGYPKLSITINGQSPGPTLSAHQGDALVIDVTNGLVEEDIAIQWSGVRPVCSKDIRKYVNESGRFMRADVVVEVVADWRGIDRPHSAWKDVYVSIYG